MKKVKEFLEFLRVEQGRSPHTIEAYGRDLRQWQRFTGGSDVTQECGSCTTHESEIEFDYETVTTNDIRAWLGSMAEQGIESASLRRKTQSLRAFYSWGERKGIFRRNPAADVILPKKGKHLPDFIKESEIENLLKQMGTQSEERRVESGDGLEKEFERKRNYLIILMLYSLGIRQAELLALTDADISFEKSEIRVTGKRKKQRVLPLPAELAEHIRELQRLRDAGKTEFDAPKPLITTRRGKMSKIRLYRIVHEALQQTNVKQKSPHTLRHTFATAMLNDGSDLDAVREMLGHSSLSTTQIYTHLSVRELMQNYRGAHPRNQKKLKNE